MKVEDEETKRRARSLLLLLLSSDADSMLKPRIRNLLFSLLALVSTTWASSPPSDHTNNWAVLVCTSRYW